MSIPLDLFKKVINEILSPQEIYLNQNQEGYIDPESSVTIVGPGVEDKLGDHSWPMDINSIVLSLYLHGNLVIHDLPGKGMGGQRNLAGVRKFLETLRIRGANFCDIQYIEGDITLPDITHLELDDRIESPSKYFTSLNTIKRIIGRILFPDYIRFTYDVIIDHMTWNWIANTSNLTEKYAQRLNDKGKIILFYQDHHKDKLLPVLEDFAQFCSLVLYTNIEDKYIVLDKAVIQEYKCNMIRFESPNIIWPSYRADNMVVISPEN